MAMLDLARHCLLEADLQVLCACACFSRPPPGGAAAAGRFAVAQLQLRLASHTTTIAKECHLEYR